MKSVNGALLLASLLTAAACGGGTKPRSHPSPVVTGTPAARGGGDSARRIAEADPKRDTVVVSDTALTRSAVAVFGDSTLPPRPADSSAGVDTEEPTWDIDVRSYETHRRVEHWVNVFTGSARSYFTDRLQRGSRYQPMIRSTLRAAGIPEDMTYLALIESGYDPHAYSRAAAVGMWQFMTTTARGTGLRVDWWIDDRRDPVRATAAAAKFLGWLREQFGSLYLAAAAYNGGPGRVARGLSRYADDLEGTTGEDVFFALAEKTYLRAETRDYVPKLIAAALVAKDPARYGIAVRELPPLVYDSVLVPASTPLAAVAKASGATVAEIGELNPRVLRGVTPPEGKLQLRIPLGRADDFDHAFAALPKADLAAYTRVTSKKGQTVATIARIYNLSAKQLGWYNPKLAKLKSGKLRAGQTVLVPSRGVVAAARDVPDPAIEIYGGARRGSRVHVVKRGENLGVIARKYRTTVNTLVRLNGLRKKVIYPGQTIIVRGAPRAKASASRATASRSTKRSSGGARGTTRSASTTATRKVAPKAGSR